MKKFVFRSIVAFAYFSLVFTNTSSAQISPTNDTDGRVNTISTAVPFLRIVADARSGAMGDVGLAISPDANAMHFNASKLAFADKDFSISATYTPWLRALGLQDVYLAYLTGYKRLDKIQTMGFGLRFFSLGSIQFTDDRGNALQTERPTELEASLAYSRALGENFSAGLTMKYIYSRLANGEINGQVIKPGNAVAADLSFTARKPMDNVGNGSLLTIGAAITNLGTKISYTSNNRDFIPTNLGVGGAFEYNIDDFNSLTFALDVNKLLVPTPDTIDGDANGIWDYREKSVPAGLFSSFGDAPGGFSEEMKEFMFSVGAEYWYDKQFAVRLGYYNENRLKGNRKFFTVGVGLKYNVFGLNFSYLVPTSNQRNPLDNTLRFSLLFDFGSANKD